ncbi:MAG TPA: hypothetical protein VGY97_09755 [Solirubrobacteraceae bacterium]|jgi:hypothetical protein|nr:hypothetical protein [Solirubrobacteraceae bacterium]
MSFESFGARVTVLGLGFAAADLLLGGLALATVGHGGRLEVFPGIDVVGLYRPGSLLGWSSAAVLASGLVAAAAWVRPGLRASLWAPAGLFGGAGMALLVDSMADGRVTRWLDPPLWAPLNPADIALVVAGLLMAYGVGVALGGGAGGTGGGASE